MISGLQLKKPKIIFPLLVIFGLSIADHTCYAQNQQNQTETWYVWIDTPVNIDGSTFRVISDKPIMITCCVKSGKYRKLSKNAGKWLQKNVSPEFDGKLQLMKLQDRELAEKIVSDIQRGVTPSEYEVKIVKYRARCS